MALLTRGTSVGDFVALEPIGEGGQSTVWSATFNGNIYALKIIQRSAATPRLIAQFEQEIKVVQSLEHPNVLPIEQVISTAQYIGYASPFFLGGDLFTRLQTEPYELGVRLHYIHQIVQALAHLHEKGVVHRDLKPMNILMNLDRQCYLADFGIARQIFDETAQLHTGRGTLAYASLEQLRREPISRLSDIYSFGVLLYEIFCGHLPWNNESQLSVLQARDEAIRLPDLTGPAASLPPGVIGSLRRMTHPEPTLRFQYVQEAFNAVVSAIPEGRQTLFEVRAQTQLTRDDASMIIESAREILSTQADQFPLNLTRYAILEAAKRNSTPSQQDLEILLHGALTYNYGLDYWWAASASLGANRIDLARKVLHFEQDSAGAIQSLLNVEPKTLQLNISDYDRLLDIAIHSTNPAIKQQALTLTMWALPEATTWQMPAISKTVDDKLGELIEVNGALTSEAVDIASKARAVSPIKRLVDSEEINTVEQERFLRQVLEGTGGSLPHVVPLGKRLRLISDYYWQQLLHPSRNLLPIRAVYCGLGAILAAIMMLLGMFGASAQRVEDLFFAGFPRSDIITIVAIDNASLSAFGRWDSWSRELHAEILTELNRADAEVVVFDVLFVSETADDEALANALADLPRVVQPAVGEGNGVLDSVNNTIAYQSIILPDDGLMQAGGRVGHTNILHDSDGIVRRLPLFIEADDKLFPSLAIVSLEAFLGSDTVEAMPSQAQVTFAGRTIPVEVGTSMRLNFVGSPSEIDRSETFPIISYVDVIEGNYDESLVEGRIVLIGVMATAEPDQYLTPISQGQPMYGVEILANAIETIWSGRFIKEANLIVQIGLLALLGILVGALSRSILWSAVTTLGLALTTFIAASTLFDTQGVLLSVFYMFLTLVFSFALATIYRLLTLRNTGL